MICLDRAVRILPGGVRWRADQLVEDPWVDLRTLGREHDRDRASAQRPGEAAPGGRQVTPYGQQNVDDLAVLIDRPVEN